MKNLTPWCNLYSIESKYNITIKPSRYKTYLYSVLIFSLLAALLSAFSVNYYPLAVFSLAFYLALSFIITRQSLTAQSLAAQSLTRHNSNQTMDDEVFTLTIEGLCLFNEGMAESVNLQLTPYSRVSFLGCWLLFSQDNNDDKPRSKFIFKDSLSSTDYSRLRRVIVALKSLS